MGLIPCTCGLSDLLCLSWNPNWQKQKSWAGFQSESVQACSLPADQTGSQVALHQCDGFIWLRNLINFYIALCSHISTEVFRMVKILNKNKPKRLALKWCVVIPSRLALSQLTKQKRILIMLHLTNMQWVCLALDILWISFCSKCSFCAADLTALTLYHTSMPVRICPWLFSELGWK